LASACPCFGPSARLTKISSGGSFGLRSPLGPIWPLYYAPRSYARRNFPAAPAPTSTNISTPVYAVQCQAADDRPFGTCRIKVGCCLPERRLDVSRRNLLADGRLTAGGRAKTLCWSWFVRLAM
jgi:hypothetical protein